MMNTARIDRLLPLILIFAWFMGLIVTLLLHGSFYLLVACGLAAAGCLSLYQGSKILRAAGARGLRIRWYKHYTILVGLSALCFALMYTALFGLLTVNLVAGIILSIAFGAIGLLLLIAALYLGWRAIRAARA